MRWLARSWPFLIKIRNKYFELVIYGSIRRSDLFLDDVVKYNNKFIFIPLIGFKTKTYFKFIILLFENNKTISYLKFFLNISIASSSRIKSGSF